MDKQKPIRLEYNEGCMSWGTYINDIQLSDYSIEDLKDLAKELIDSIGDGQNNYYIFQQFFDSFIMEKGEYKSLGRCEECGDNIDRYTYIYDSNKK